jgi:hypothetical protein
MEPPDAQAPELLGHTPVSVLAHGQEEIMTIPQALEHDPSAQVNITQDPDGHSLNGRSLQHVPGDDYAMEPHRTKSDDGLATVVAPAERAFSTTRPSPPSFAQSEFHMVRISALCTFFA